MAREEITKNHTQTAAREATNRMTEELYATPPGGGVTDHGALTGLTDDDHTQYHNDARGDARYVNEADHTKVAHDALDIDADTLDGIDSAGFAAASHGSTHIGTGSDNIPLAIPGGAGGLLSGANATKVDKLGVYAAVRRTTEINPAHNTVTPVPMEQEDIDTGGFFNLATAPDRFTIPATGFYLVMFNTAFVGLSGAASRCLYRMSHLDSVGSSLALYKAEGDGASGGAPGIPLTIMVQLSATDQLVFEVFQNSGAAQRLFQHTNAAIWRLA